MKYSVLEDFPLKWQVYTVTSETQTIDSALSTDLFDIVMLHEINF